jgi:hypothetical protein
MNLIAYVDARIGRRPLCGHEEDEKTSDDKKESND